MSYAAYNTILDPPDVGFAVGVSLLGAGVAVGPSVGHLYAGDTTHARKMMLARALAFGAGTLGYVQLGLCFYGPCNSLIGLGVMTAGLSTATLLAAYDLVDSLFVVQRTEGRPVRARFARGLGLSPR